MKKVSALSLLVAAMALPASAYDINSMSWEEIEAQAKEEGSVTFSVWYLQPAWREFVKAFEDETGITVRIPEGTLDANRNKLVAEARRDEGAMDVVALGAATMKTFDFQETLLKLDKLPELSKLKTKSEGVDSQGYGVTFWGNQTGLAYDPARIDESQLPQTFAELEQYIKNNPHSFGVNDPNGGGSGGRFIEAAIRQINGEQNLTDVVDKKVVKSWSKTWDWFQANKGNMLITASNADSLTRINDGEITIAPAWEDHLAGLQERGAITKRIKFYIPEFGMSGGGNFVTIARNTRNPAASLVFVDWLTSAKAQGLLNKQFGSAPQHPEADASNSLVSNEMRANSTAPFSAAYASQISKQFTRKVLMQ